MQKISLSSNTMPQTSLGRGRKSSDVLTKKNKGANTGAARNMKRALSESRSLEHNKNRKRLETKSSIIRKPIAFKNESRVKKNLDSNQKSKSTDKVLEKPRAMLSKKEANTLKKEVPKKSEVAKRSINKEEKKPNITTKEKSSADSEFKRKFNSILHKSVSEPKTPTFSLQKPKNLVDKTTKRSIFNSKTNEKPTLQIETWGPAQAPKPLFNLSKALMRSNAADKKSVTEKLLPNTENMVKRASKPTTTERSPDKPIVSKIWKF